MAPLKTLAVAALAVLASCAPPQEQFRSKLFDVHSSEDRHIRAKHRSESGGEFGRNSTEAEVLAVMGRPDDERTISSSGQTVWSYKFSSVSFKNGRVVSWLNGSRNLKVRGREGDEKERIAGRPPSQESGGGLYAPAGLQRSIPQPETYGATNPDLRWVDAHQRKDGTPVAGHFKTAPDSSRHNNFSSRGNRNTFTGKKGYR